MSLSSYIESVAKKWTKPRAKPRSHRDELLEIVDAEPDKMVGVSIVRIKAGWHGRQADIFNTLALLVEDGVLEVYLGEKPKTGGRQPRFYRRKA
jgi:hypothetical protein